MSVVTDETQRQAERTERLRQAGLWTTASRPAVLKALAKCGAHANVDLLAVAVSARMGTLSTQVVYDNLNTFFLIGLVWRLERAGHPMHCEPGTITISFAAGAGHKTSTVPWALLSAISHQPSEDHGFIVEEAEVTVGLSALPARTQTEF